VKPTSQLFTLKASCAHNHQETPLAPPLKLRYQKQPNTSVSSHLYILLWSFFLYLNHFPVFPAISSFLCFSCIDDGVLKHFWGFILGVFASLFFNRLSIEAEFLSCHKISHNYTNIPCCCLNFCRRFCSFTGSQFFFLYANFVFFFPVLCNCKKHTLVQKNRNDWFIFIYSHKAIPSPMFRSLGLGFP